MAMLMFFLKQKMSEKEHENEFEHHVNPDEIHSYMPAVIGLGAGILVATGIIFMLKGFSLTIGAAMVLVFILLILIFLRGEIPRWPKITKDAEAMVKEGGTPGKFHEIGDVGFPTALFLLSEIAFFGGAFIAYFYLRSQYISWPPAGTPHLDVLIPSIQTGLLIVSSIMIEWSTAGVKKGNNTAVKFGFLGAVILGAGFAVIQMGYEWPHLLSSGELTVQSGLFGASFFLLTGIHGCHVIAGVLANIVVTIRAFRGQFDKENHGFLEAAGTYWHFVHIVWLFLFAFLWQDGLSYFQVLAA